jgi:phosphoglycerate dehydrogenase-like enzyme
MDGRIAAGLFFPFQEVLPHLQDRHMERLRGELPVVDWRLSRTEDGFLRDLPDCAIAVVWRFETEWLRRAERLRVIATPAAGREWIQPLEGPNLRVWFGSFHGELMAETTLAMILAFSRGVRLGLELRDRDPWPRSAMAAHMRTVRNSRAVIVGFGNIGKWVGRMLKRLGVRVTGVNRSDMTRPDYFDAADRVLPLADLDGALPECDHLVLALPGVPEADGLIDARRLALLPAEACLYNIGRGNAVDMAALVAALRSGALAGAGLDVFDREPLPGDHPIRSCPNVILLPHVSAFSPNYLDLYLDELLPKIRRFLAGGAPVA